jgi:hypothetical protein
VSGAGAIILKRITVPDYRGAATTEGVVAPRRSSNGENCIMQTPKAPSGRHFTSRIVSPGKSYGAAAANCVLETPPTDIHRQRKVTLTTKAQQIMAGLQTEDTEQNRSALL